MITALTRIPFFFFFFFSFRAGRYDSTDRHCKNCVGFYEINQGNNSAFPVVITRAQYSVIQNYRDTRADSGRGKQATEQSTEQAVNLVSMALAEIFKDGLPDWFPMITADSDSGAITDATAQLLPTDSDTTSTPVPVADHFEQPSPSLFDPETANECAEALQNGFPAISNHDDANDSVTGAIMDTTLQLPTGFTSAPVSVENDFKQPSLHESSLSLFAPETTDACAEAFKDDSESSLSDALINGTARPSTMSVSDPVANDLERPSLYVPSLFNLGGVDGTWSPLSELLLQN